MAKQKRRSTSTRKPTTKRAPSKSRNKRKKSSTLKKDLIIFFSVLALIGMVTLGYMWGKKEDLSKNPHSKTVLQNSINDDKEFIRNIQKVQQKISDKEDKRRQEALRKAQEQKERETALKKAELEALKQDRHVQKKEERNVLIVTDNPIYTEENITDKEQKSLPTNGKPKLVIIIDDVSSRAQLDRILSLKLKLTPSIFPPFKRSPQNHKLAEGLMHYMIHLPMESGRSFDKQTKTLMTSDSKEAIEARVKEIRELFPTARYINNHTGSVFTDNYKAMEILFGTLKKEGFIFVDSRTIASTKVPMIAKKYAQRYLARDTFIDNKLNQTYIHQQLRYAVNQAKKRGYAIAIGHPHKVTLQALSKAEDILGEVEVVYIDELEKGEGQR